MNWLLSSILLLQSTLSLPDPLLDLKGKPVTTAKQWSTQRRPEILKLYEEHVFGHTPQQARAPQFELLEEKKSVLDGLATRRRVRLYLTGAKTGPWADLLLYIPSIARTPVPAFLGMNYLGNHSITSETDIPLTTAWIRDFQIPGIVNNKATESSRGAQARRWPLKLILSRGYAVATLCYAEVEPDNPNGEKTALRSQSDWGTIGIWAFGLSKAMDYLTTVPAIDSRRVALTGHSRLGKTSLWAGAQDQRFGLVISNDSGEGGASLARRKSGERISDSVKVNSFWYSPNYRKYADHEEDLPVDSHFLISLIAPRPVYVSSATQDIGADPEGEFLGARGAEPVYRLFKKKGLGSSSMPPPDRSIGDTVGYHVRTGIHDILQADWEHHLAFADRHFKK